MKIIHRKKKQGKKILITINIRLSLHFDFECLIRFNWNEDLWNFKSHITIWNIIIHIIIVGNIMTIEYL